MHLICQSPPCCSIVKIKARYNSLPLASKVGKLASNAAKLQFQTKVVGKVVQLNSSSFQCSKRWFSLLLLLGEERKKNGGEK